MPIDLKNYTHLSNKVCQMYKLTLYSLYYSHM